MRRGLVFAGDQLEPLPGLARRAEIVGFDRVWTTEYRGRDAVARALAVALATETIEIGTGVAYAFGRLPLTMAALAADVQRLADGRFSLGVSAATKGIRRAYGAADFTPPAPRLAAYVEELRRAFAADPALARPPRLYGAAMNAAMSRTVAARFDGALLHALALTRVHLRERLLPALRAGAARRGDGGAPELVAWCVTAVDPDPAMARERARTQLAFYLATPSFAPATAGASWEGAARSVRAAFDASDRRARWRDLAPLVPDEAVDELAIWGAPAAAREKAEALAAELAAAGVGELVFQPCGAEADATRFVRDCELILDELGPGSES